MDIPESFVITLSFQVMLFDISTAAILSGCAQLSGSVPNLRVGVLVAMFISDDMMRLGYSFK